MSELFDLINIAHSLFLTEIVEHVQNGVTIAFKESVVSNDEEFITIGRKTIGSARRVSVDEKGDIYQIIFDNCAAYHVIDQSFATFDDGENIGRLLRVYTNSKYLDYIRDTTIVEHIREGELKHYRLICEFYVIDVASVYEPILSKLYT
jgi:hypothetical protein